MQITLTQAITFLNSYYTRPVIDVQSIGAGAWSQCFGYQVAGKDYVIRFGAHHDDFERDQYAMQFASDALPIPEVYAIGNAFAGYYAISQRVYGTPLETISAEDWQALIPNLATTLEALRTAPLPIDAQIGDWWINGEVPQPGNWADYLLAIEADTPALRIHGWRKKLAQFPKEAACFDWGMQLLHDIADPTVQPNVVHCDLINRNVFVADNKISGVFDWGCGLYGDHLYDLAWFQFWAPWHPNLDVAALYNELKQRWQAANYTVDNAENRLAACYLHIGLSHLAYNAYMDDVENLKATAVRMEELINSQRPTANY